MNNNSETRLQNCFTTLSLYLNVEVSWILQWQQRSADRPYNTEIVFISQNEGKSLRKDSQI